jgi:hypothetical protein
MACSLPSVDGGRLRPRRPRREVPRAARGQRGTCRHPGPRHPFDPSITPLVPETFDKIVLEVGVKRLALSQGPLMAEGLR